MEIADGKVVDIHYTLKDEEGTVLDSSEGQEPLSYLHGAGNIIPGLEKALSGKDVGDTLAVVVQPNEGYGERRDELIQTLPMSNFQDPSQVQLGARFRVQTPEAMFVATVTQIVGDTVTIDMNHPLAGVPLHFNVEVMGIKDATAEELEHGHVHAPGEPAH